MRMTKGSLMRVVVATSANHTPSGICEVSLALTGPHTAGPELGNFQEGEKAEDV